MYHQTRKHSKTSWHSTKKKEGQIVLDTLLVLWYEPAKFSNFHLGFLAAAHHQTSKCSKTLQQSKWCQTLCSSCDMTLLIFLIFFQKFQHQHTIRRANSLKQPGRQRRSPTCTTLQPTTSNSMLDRQCGSRTTSTSFAPRLSINTFALVCRW